MINAKRLEEVAQTDAFLAQEKFLLGPPPVWTKSEWAGEYVAVWNVADSDGTPIAVLNGCALIKDRSVAGLNLIYRRQPVWRIHIDHPGVCHDNLHDAHRLGLDAVVCGPHEHAWPINRDHILRQDVWETPYRRAVGVRRLSAALALLADQINLTLTPDQRGFDGPTKGDLFDMVDV